MYTAVLGVVLWRLPIGRRLRVAAVVLVIVLGVLPTAWLLSSPLERRFPVPANLDRVDGIIVLGGAERAGLSKFYGQPLLNTAADRLTTFLMLARRFPDARLVHSGDTAPESESAVARQLLIGAGIDPQRIVFESKSRITCGSPRATLDARRGRRVATMVARHFGDAHAASGRLLPRGRLGRDAVSDELPARTGPVRLRTA